MAEPTVWPALAAALDVVRESGLPAGWIVRAGEDVGHAIRQTAAELYASLIILGWRGTDPGQNASLAAVLENLFCDVASIGGSGGDAHLHADANPSHDSYACAGRDRDCVTHRHAAVYRNPHGDGHFHADA